MIIILSGHITSFTLTVKLWSPLTCTSFCHTHSKPNQIPEPQSQSWLRGLYYRHKSLPPWQPPHNCVQFWKASTKPIFKKSSFLDQGRHRPSQCPMNFQVFTNHDQIWNFWMHIIHWYYGSIVVFRQNGYFDTFNWVFTFFWHHFLFLNFASLTTFALHNLKRNRF